MTESILIDTNIIIDHLRGKSAALEFLELNIKDGKKLLLSVIARVELMSGMRPDEEAKIESFLSIFEEVVINRDVAVIAGRYMNTYARSHGLNTADAIIAASAKFRSATLYTLNIKHFPLDDIRVLRPY